MTTLDEWEEAAKLYTEDFNEMYSEAARLASKRLIALIDLVRKKDLALEKITRGRFETGLAIELDEVINRKVLAPAHHIALEALALTENLK